VPALLFALPLPINCASRRTFNSNSNIYNSTSVNSTKLAATMSTGAKKRIMKASLPQELIEEAIV
jgi:hypothetical protein